MNSEQTKYLQDRLNRAKRKHEYAFEEYDEEEPAEVLKAREVIKLWEEERINAPDLTDKIKKEADEIRELILFGDTTAALNAVKQFEAKNFMIE